MAIDELDIKRLREQAEHELQETERNLDALKRVEAMLERQKNGSSRSKPKPPREPVQRGVNTGLKARVGEILRESGETGLRPKDIVAVVEQEGYPFSSHAVAASSVSSALARYGGNAHKKENGRFVWVEGLH